MFIKVDGSETLYSKKLETAVILAGAVRGSEKTYPWRCLTDIILFWVAN